MSQNAILKALADLIPGQAGRVAFVVGEAGVRHRLLEMGLTRGTLVKLVRVAPMGDPVELDFRGYRLSVRRSEAAAVHIEAL
ncbi:MAG: FeoA domain-containing protein [Planctomycetes bacterium]|nr:FeoA domain-containing protein [Planctomycetota bacterium]